MDERTEQPKGESLTHVKSSHNVDLPVDLAGWLTYLESIHPQSIDMGLDRVEAVKGELKLTQSFAVITVGGTNGKGSTCRMLESIYHQAGYRVGCYLSPHLMRYNERVRVGGQDVTDQALVEAFMAVERARRLAAVSLTYFEFGTLAAMWVFAQSSLELVVLEVGLGGRLDAVNVFEPDCSVVTSVAMDHMEYLGDTRELIGFEKAGIFRHEKPAICADNDPPQSLVKHAEAIGAQLLVKGRDFDFKSTPLQWSYWGPQGVRHALPWPALRGRYQLSNAAAALTVLGQMGGRCPVSINHIREGMLLAENPGRFQVLPGQPTVVLDVAHNPHAAAALVDSLKQLPKAGRTVAVFSMLSDKEIASVIEILRPSIDHWWVAGIAGPRGCTGDYLCTLLQQAGITALSTARDLQSAFFAARKSASEDDKIIVFGSFYTVAAVMSALEDSKQDSKQYLTRSAQ
jgi:dihydrofolate synthase/folylpolyglutamate synthase